MFIRVKILNKGTATYVQLVRSIRKIDRNTLKIVLHIGVAKDSEELKELRFLAESIKLKFEAGSLKRLVQGNR